MNPATVALFACAALLLWLVPRRYAPAPLLAGCCYMTDGQGIEIGPVSLPVFRMLMAIGFLRVMIKGERIEGGLNTIDKLVIAMSAWLLFASFFHNGIDGSGPVYISGLLFNLLLVYFLTRTWTRNHEELEDLVRIVAWLLLPVAAAMMIEKATAKNVFSVFGGIPESVLMREGKLRAQGPFGHPILAGTVGATCLPWFCAILSKHRTAALVGIGSALVIVFASTSSGPVMSLIASLCALMIWRWRHLVRPMAWAAVASYLVLMLVMERPPYYLISKIDISGGSTGWHRSFLIEQTFKHLSEWWLTGTDFTRHWMPYQGIAYSQNHTDITNHYIAYGVMGGLPAMCLMILAVVTALRRVLDAAESSSDAAAFSIWACGCGLFSHAVTGISVSYFDQSMLFFWLNLAAAGSMSPGVPAAHPATAGSVHRETPGGHERAVPHPDNSR